ncbi:MAG: MerR family DNA-binding protein, partial [Chloroflexota bacterium]|nr:MerR family DNA-binding protein [Chloroflexota bacterium]
SGYRLYDAADRDRLNFIVKAKALDLTLEEIGEILSLRGDGQQPCTHVVQLLDRKLQVVDEQLRALEDFRQELVAMRKEAAEAVAGSSHVCRIIEQHKWTHHPEHIRRRPTSASDRSSHSR